MREFVSLVCYGLTNADTTEIILSCYGPRGGLRACESASPDAMRNLRDQIDRALEKFES